MPISALWLTVVAPAWALPFHEYDMEWGRGGLHGKPDREDHAYNYGNGDRDEKLGKYDKDSRGKLKKYEGYGGHDFPKWGKG